MKATNTTSFETKLSSIAHTTLKPPIFILGSGRSGTTLLRSILKNHPDIYCIDGETHLFSPDSNPYLEDLEIFQSQNDIKNLTLTIISSILFGHECTTLFARKRKFPKDVIEVFNEVKDLINTNRPINKYEIFNVCITTITIKENKKRWAEKTPNNIFNLQEIITVYPEAKFIEVYRDPRGVFYSWKNAKQDYFKKTNIIECINKWNKAFEYSKKYAFELLNQFYKLKYEDLIENPHRELANLCKFLNEDFNQLLLEVTTKSLDFDKTSDTKIWKDNLTKNELLLIDLKTKKYRKELGYTDSDARFNLINCIPFYLFYAKKILERQQELRFIIKVVDKIISPLRHLLSLLGTPLGRTFLLINKLLGRTILLINKFMGIGDELLQAVFKKPYSFRRKCKSLFWAIKRKSKIKKYINSQITKKLHIGAGPNILPGWLNTNIIPLTQEDIFLDASRRFPFDDNSFDYIFSEHQIEHLNYMQGLIMLKECFRVLKPDGKIRITTPDLESFINLYKNPGEIEKAYIDYTIKRLFPELEQNKKIFVLNNLFTNFGHRFIYDKNTLETNLKTTGFVDIKFYAQGKTEEKVFKDIEGHPKMFERFGLENGEELSRFDTFACEATKPFSNS